MVLRLCSEHFYLVNKINALYWFKLLECPSGQNREDLIKVTNKNINVENLKIEVMISGEKGHLRFSKGAVKRFYQQVMNHETEL